MRDIELLAPARNADIGIAAIDCGADAVYIAAPRFGARKDAGNNIEDIARLCEYAHRFGARVFVTLNTIIYESELEEAEDLLFQVQDAGADAVIVQDMAFFQMLQKGKIRIPLHASTQCAIRDPERAKMLEEAGASRLILERQLSVPQIKEISRAVNCEIECFVHGALCVCYSGQCYLSELIDSRSANRGACIQACRSKYDLVDGSGRVLARDKALLSLKDFNMRKRLEEMIDAGVTSFKIEGRLKNESYVRNVTRSYSQALDQIISHREDLRRSSFGKSTSSFSPNLNKTFNRGYTELFAEGKKGAWAAMDAAKGMGEEIGTVSSLNQSHTRFSIKTNATLNNGDGLSFVTRKGEVAGVRADVCQGGEVCCKSIPELYLGARIFRNLDTLFEKEMARDKGKRMIEVRVFVQGNDKALMIKAQSEDGREVQATLLGEVVAENQQRMTALIASQLGKTSGHYAFNVEDVSGEVPLLRAAQLNEIRNSLAQSLEKMSVNSIPLYTSPMPQNLSKSSLSRENACPDQSPTEGDYRLNVANSLARAFYKERGVEVREEAFELSHRKGAELMRSKYCIRHELGICPVHHRCKSSGPLYLLNNGRRLRLDFDCKKCEMIVMEG